MLIRGLASLSSGETGIYQTVRLMRQQARQSAIDPLVRETAARAVFGVPGNDGTMQARILRDWIASRTVFLADPLYTEALHQPAAMVARILRRGVIQLDCDDVALLTAALGLSIGLRARYIIVGFRSPAAPFQHVWCDLSGVGREAWVTVDPTRPSQPLGNQRVSRAFAVEV